MATIKLQPSGKVVIKDGKVSCSCCGGCVCSVSIPKNLQDTLNNAVSASLYGIVASDFYLLLNGGWGAEWFYPDPIPGVGISILAVLQYSDGCLLGGIDYSTEETNGVANYGKPEEECILPGYTAGLGTFTINGVGSLQYFYLIGDDYEPPPAPNLVLT